MQRIGQFVLDFPSLLPPPPRILQPAAPVGHEGPCADVGDALRERVDPAVEAGAACHLPGHPVLVDDAFRAGQETEDATDECGVIPSGDVAVVRNLAHLPQQTHHVRSIGDTHDILVAGRCPRRAGRGSAPPGWAGRSARPAVGPRKRRRGCGCATGPPSRGEICAPPAPPRRRRRADARKR